MSDTFNDKQSDGDCLKEMHAIILWARNPHVKKTTVSLEVDELESIYRRLQRLATSAPTHVKRKGPR